jgi:hypothetical protein
MRCEMAHFDPTRIFRHGVDALKATDSRIYA